MVFKIPFSEKYILFNGNFIVKDLIFYLDENNPLKVEVFEDKLFLIINHWYGIQFYDIESFKDFLEDIRKISFIEHEIKE